MPNSVNKLSINFINLMFGNLNGSGSPTLEGSRGFMSEFISALLNSIASHNMWFPDNPKVVMCTATKHTSHILSVGNTLETSYLTCVLFLSWAILLPEREWG